MRDPDTEAPVYSKEEIESENELLLIADLHSSSAAICGFLFYITRNSRVYDKVTNEIRSTFKFTNEISTESKLFACFQLRACIDETLRLISAKSFESSREILFDDLRIDGEFILKDVEIEIST